MSSRTCVADIEADGLLETVTKAHCGVFIDVKTEEVFEFTPDNLSDMFKFMDSCSALIFHHGYGYDFPMLKQVYGYEYKGKKIDTLILSRMLFPHYQSHSVDAWGTRFNRPKPKHEDWTTYTPEMLHRCKEDTFIQLQLYRQCLKVMKRDKWPIESFKLTFKLFEILHLQEQSGWPVDEQSIRKSIRMLDKWIERIDKVIVPRLPNVVESPYTTHVAKPFRQDRQLAAIAKRWYEDKEDQKTISGPFSRIEFRKVNLNSNAELKDFLLSEGWEPREWNYKKDPKTKRPLKDENNQPIKSSPKIKHDDPFIGIDGGLGRLAAKRVQCRARKSIMEGWLSNIRSDGTISQRITGIASTGRLTHSGIVNVPGNQSFFGKQMRQVFVAKDPYVLVGTDSSGCQDRMLLGRANAYGVNDPVFEDMLLNGNKSKGTDSHSRARNVLNEVFTRNRMPTITRSGAKNFNYAYKFNAMDKKLGSMAKSTPKIGGEIRSALDSIFTAQVEVERILVKEWRSNARQRINSWGKAEYVDGYFKGLDGRPIYVHLEKDVLVYALQSDEAIMMQYALCFLYKWLTKRNFVYGKDYHFVANVHDEYQALVHKDRVDEYVRLADRSISYAAEHLKIQCPHKGESDIGKSWYETH